MQDRSILLIPKFATAKEAMEYIEAISDEVFVAELKRYIEEPLWISSRSRDLFHKWFTVELHFVVNTMLIADL